MPLGVGELHRSEEQGFKPKVTKVKLAAFFLSAVTGALLCEMDYIDVSNGFRAINAVPKHRETWKEHDGCRAIDLR